MAQLTTLQQINIEKVSQYLNAEAIAKGSLFGAKKSPTSPVVLYMERKGIEYIYGLDPTESTLRLNGDYLYGLCKKNKQASYILNQGSGGSISPAVPGSIQPYEFTVDSTTFIATGDSSKTFPTSWRGVNILFIRNHAPQSTINEGGTYFSWNSSTRLFTLLPSGGGGQAIAGELFQIYPQL